MKKASCYIPYTNNAYTAVVHNTGGDFNNCMTIIMPKEGLVTPSTYEFEFHASNKKNTHFNVHLYAHI